MFGNGANIDAIGEERSIVIEQVSRRIQFTEVASRRYYLLTASLRRWRSVVDKEGSHMPVSRAARTASAVMLQRDCGQLTLVRKRDKVNKSL